MSKELPYFKFEVSEWINGLITLEEYSTQGLFVNICAHYWFKSGKLKLSEIKRRLFKSKAEDFQALIDRGIIKVLDDTISITFLDSQLQERVKLSSQNSANGSKGGRPKSETKPTALFPVSESKAKESNIEEKRREETRIKEINTAGDKSPTLAERQKEFYNSLVPYTNQYTKTMVREFYEYWTEHSANGKKMRFEKEKVFDTARRLKTWAARAREEPKVLTTTQNYTGAEVDFKNMNRDAWEKIYEYSLKTDNEFRKHFNYAELQKGTPMGVNS